MLLEVEKSHIYRCNKSNHAPQITNEVSLDSSRVGNSENIKFILGRHLFGEFDPGNHPKCNKTSLYRSDRHEHVSAGGEMNMCRTS